jgi:damage-control phosphatase, subfamily I
MFFDPACVPCIVKQAYNSARLFTNGNKELQLKIIKEVCAETINIDEQSSAPLFSKKMQLIIEKYYSAENPYKKIKEENIKKAQTYYSYLKIMVENSNDKLEMALRIAITGNTIDFASNPDFDLDYDINRITSNNIDLSFLPKFKENLKNTKLILYIGDNYEEALFDKFLLNELLPRKVVFAVRSKSILNDITLEDAKKLEIDKLCEVIESGSTIAGTDLNECTPEFLELYHKADIVISKGQGNYETLIDESRAIYFLFKVKCAAIASRSSYKKGQGVLLYNQDGNREKL